MKKRIILLLSIILIFISISACYFQTETIVRKSINELKISFIDVGQADSILLQTPNGKSVLIDAGNSNDYGTISAYINKQKIKTIDVLAGTHPHEDHIGAMAEVIKNYDIGSIYMPKVTANTKVFKNLLKTIKDKKIQITNPVPGKTIDIDKDVNIGILAPNSNKYGELNNYSIVLKLTYDKTSFIFMGDASAESEKEILEKKYDLKADVLKIGHHGSSSATTASFLEAVNPKYAIISVGKENDYGHPAKEILDRLKASKIKVLRTDELGTIVITSDGNTIKLDKNVSAIKTQAPPETNGVMKPKLLTRRIL